MKVTTRMIREGYDGKKCLVHARMCVMPDGKIISTAQDLNVFGSDLFDGIKLSVGLGDYILQKGLSRSILIPVYMGEDERTKYDKYDAAVMRCAFDGERLIFFEIGNPMKLDVERGFCEPSIVKHEGVYHLTLRNDLNGYHTTSRDGLHFEEPELWRFDVGEVIPTYNTRQHWLTCGGKLYLIYTRRGLDNDHVFRHRAPLVMAEVKDGAVIKDSEVIVAPNRGARLGNFGVCQVIGDENRAFIMVSEWMQPRGCEQYGSNNAIWVTEVEA